MRVVATAGHVDHGKSALVLALTGTDPDRWAEEKRRGLTIDLGFAHMMLPSGQGISFVDVPGHVRFLRNMLAGVGAVDACLFVVAATEGWKPQSEEHLRILELVGVAHGVLALTKRDLVDDDELDLARLDVADRVAGSFLASAAVVPVSVATGDGLDELIQALDAMVATTPAAVDRGRPRLWVDRVFAAKGSGTVVTGTLAGGSVAVGDQLVAGPDERPVRVRAIQTLGRSVERIGPGNRIALNLVGIEHRLLRRGDAVVQPGRWRPTTRFDATLRVLPGLDHSVTKRGAYAAYLGSGEHPVQVRLLSATSLPPGDVGVARFRLATPLALLPGDRYVLRESGRGETIGGGEILDVAPTRIGARVGAATASAGAADRLLADRGWITVEDLEALTGEVRPPVLGRWVAAPGLLDELVENLSTRIEQAGPLGLDLATLDERAREALDRVPGVVVTGGRARPATAADPLADHPFVALLEAGGVAPPGPEGVARDELRELVRQGRVVERDGVYFAPSAIDTAATTAARLLLEHPDGFTVAQLREALATTRKYALPLANELDARGVTRRRDDLRVGGPRLPAL
jgi:selenocysteine-specific elongation factor